MQMIIQARWVNESPFLCLPHVENYMIYLFKKKKIVCLPQLWELCQGQCEPLASTLRPEMEENLIDGVFETLQKLPMLSVDMTIREEDKPPFLVAKQVGKLFVIDFTYGTLFKAKYYKSASRGRKTF